MACKDNTQFVSADEARKCGRNNSIIFGEICAIQQAILSAIDNNKLETIVDDNSPMTKVNEILDVFVTNGGSGYSTFQAQAEIVHPFGTGAVITPVVTGSSITDFIVVNSGSSYDPVMPLVDATGQGNGSAQIQVIESNGMIVQANVIVPGSGYVAGFILPVIHPTGTNAVVQISTVDGAGAITGVSVVNPGQNYNTILATVVINHPLGQNFAGTVTVSGGQVTGVTILNGGQGYGELRPTAVATGSSGSGAEFEVIVNSGMIVGITLLESGAGYDENTQIVISDHPTGIGSGATAIAQVDSSETNSLDYYLVWTGQVTDRSISDQLDQVTKYFQKLGYNIKIETNPITQNSIRWHIFW